MLLRLRAACARCAGPSSSSHALLPLSLWRRLPCASSRCGAGGVAPHSLGGFALWGLRRP
eukprot:7053911-Alexandrium_andersonii.AAC.1